jgi:hypothetical protein
MSNDVEIGVSSKLKSKKGFDDAEREGSKLEKKLAGIGDRAGAGMGKVGGKLTEGLSGAFKAGPLAAVGVGAGIGAVLVGGFQQALDRGEIQATLAAQLGLHGDNAAKYGKAAADLWKNGYGESIQETADITKAAFESGLISAKSSKEAIADVGAQVAVYNKLTGEDAVASTRAVAQMIKTGLAKNATEAFDILTRGQQLGINKSEDLLDTFNEYGTQFRKLGLNAEDSLGLMNQMLQAGARDSDTAADAIKEFAIRAVDGSKTTSQGFQMLGLDAGKMADAIGKGGPAARTAFGDILDGLNKITDPVKRNQAGVDLFGTKWEDLGAAIGKADLDTAAGSLGKVAGAASEVNDALSNTPGAKIQALQRKLQATFVDLFTKFALPAVTKFVDWMNGPGIYKMSEWALGASEAVLGFVDKFLAGLDSMLGAVEDWGKWTLRAMAATFAVFNPGLAKSMLDASNKVGDWAKSSRASIQSARDKISDWNTSITNMKTEAKLKADKADLEQKIKSAKLQLQDPALTATKKAALTATIKQLQDQVNAAQRKIDGLHGKTVTTNIVMKYTQQGVNITAPSRVGGNWAGGGVKGYAGGGSPQASNTFLVGEYGPELLSMSGGSGRVTPASNTRQQLAAGGGTSKVVLEFASGGGGRLEDLFMAMVREFVRVRGGNVQTALGWGR